MPQAPNTANYQIGKGVIYFKTADSEWRDLGNAPSFLITKSINTIEHYSSRHGINFKDFEVPTEINVELSFTLDEINIENLAMFFGGDVKTYTQTAGSVTGESITAYQDRYSDLQYRKVSNVVVTSDDGLTTYAEGTDYSVDTEIGRIYILSGGAISDGQQLLVNYDYDSLTFQYVEPFRSTSINGSLRFIGDPATGAKYDLVIWNVKLNLNGDFSLITDTWNSLTVTGYIIPDYTNHADNPYFEIRQIG